MVSRAGRSPILWTVSALTHWSLRPRCPRPCVAVSYYGLVRDDNARAVEEARKGLTVEPNSVVLLGRSANSEFQVGRSRGHEHFRKAVLLDPQSPNLLILLGDVELRQKHYPQADSAIARAQILVPENLAVTEQHFAASYAW